MDALKFAHLLEAVEKEFPRLVVAISGPWPPSGSEADGSPAWIVNFKQMDLSYENIHAGSRGADAAEALEKGLDAARAWQIAKSVEAAEWASRHPDNEGDAT